MLISIYKYYKLCYSLQVYAMSLPFLIELGEGHTAIDTLAFGAEGHRSSYGIVTAYCGITSARMGNKSLQNRL